LGDIQVGNSTLNSRKEWKVGRHSGRKFSVVERE
jgi:hypothetical protein